MPGRERSRREMGRRGLWSREEVRVKKVERDMVLVAMYYYRIIEAVLYF